MTPHPAASAAAFATASATTDFAPRRTSANQARSLYLSLSESVPAPAATAAAADWLAERLAKSPGSANKLLPSAGAAFAAWLAKHQDDIDEQYKQYVAERRAGGPRRLFSGRAHALHYLCAIGPTRLTDGAWLYGALARWHEPALRPLIATYLEELGNGVPDKNHVVIFQQLIDAHGCAAWQQLDEHHFEAGLTQLALAHHPERFFPELIGYNLGAERADLDTHVAAYELNELGIDPYYFTLHVTTDNSVTGHARLALEALRNLTPSDAADASAFLRRVDAGYGLHAQASSTARLLDGFALRPALDAMLEAKHLPAGHAAASLQVKGRTLAEWLTDPALAAQLPEAMADDGWISRGAPASESRLWSMIEADEAGTEDAAPPLAGLFSEYELALLADWIAQPAAGQAQSRPNAGGSVRRIHMAPDAPPRIRESAERGIIRHRFPDDEHGWEALANELSLLEARVVASNSKEEAIALLTALMGPARHHGSTGLMATRMFSQLFTA